MAQTEIIIGTDLSDNSNLAIETGMLWANMLKCHPVVMHVHISSVNSNTRHLFNPDLESKFDELANMVKEELLKKLKGQVRPWIKMQNDIEPILAFGDRAKKFVERANEKNSKLIILGWNKDLSEETLWLASTIDRVLRISKVPVLIVKDNKAMNPKRIVVPFVLNNEFVDLLEWARVLLNTFSSKFEFIHVLKDKEIVSSKSDIGVLKEFYPENEYAIEKLEEFIKFASKSNGSASVEIIPGVKSIQKELENKINGSAPDLILMSTHGLSGIEKLYMSSITEWISKASKCSVLVTKEFS